MEEYKYDCFAFKGEKVCDALNEMKCSNCSFYRTELKNALLKAKYSCAKKVVDGIVYKIKPSEFEESFEEGIDKDVT